MRLPRSILSFALLVLAVGGTLRFRESLLAFRRDGGIVMTDSQLFIEDLDSLPPGQVFKTLVVKGDRSGVCLAVIPADAELDFKAVARLSENRSVEMVPLKDVQPLTGYLRGGVTALESHLNN